MCTVVCSLDMIEVEMAYTALFRNVSFLLTLAAYLFIYSYCTVQISGNSRWIFLYLIKWGEIGLKCPHRGWIVKIYGQPAKLKTLKIIFKLFQHVLTYFRWQSTAEELLEMTGRCNALHGTHLLSANILSYLLETIRTRQRLATVA